LVKLFGRIDQEDKRFEERAARVRDGGVQRVVTGTIFFVSVGLLSAIGTALVYGIGGYLVIQRTLTIGTIVALGIYLGSLYGALQNLTNAPIDFATSMVSFERVFEVLDLPLEIAPKPGAYVLQDVRGVLEFDESPSDTRWTRRACSRMCGVLARCRMSKQCSLAIQWKNNEAPRTWLGTRNWPP